MFGGAFGDDDLAHLAVVEHMVNIVVARQQRLRAQVQFGIDLDRLRRVFFVLQDAEVGVKAQAGEVQDLVAPGGEHVDSL